MKRYIQALPLVLLLSLPVFAMEEPIAEQVEVTTAEQFQNPTYTEETTYQLTEGPELVTVVKEKIVDLWDAHRLNKNNPCTDIIEITKESPLYAGCEFDARATDPRYTDSKAYFSAFFKKLDLRYNDLWKAHRVKANKALFDQARADKLTPEEQQILSTRVLIANDSPLFVGLADKSQSKALRETDPKAYFKDFSAKVTTFHQNHARKQIQKNTDALAKITAQKNALITRENELKRIKLPKNFGVKSTELTNKNIAEQLKRISDQKPTLVREIQVLTKDNASLNAELPWLY